MSENANNGVIIGLVKSLKDPDKLGRVKVEYPVHDNNSSDWARLLSPMAGAERGLFFCPEVGDEVLVVFEHGDPRRPYIIGSLWSSKDKPPPNDGNQTENNWRFIKSRSGHIIKLDDTKSKEKIEIIDKDAKHKVIIDSANNKIQVISDNCHVEVNAGTGTVAIQATTVEIKSSGDMTLQAGGSMKIKGSTVDIN